MDSRVLWEEDCMEMEMQIILSLVYLFQRKKTEWKGVCNLQC